MTQSWFAIVLAVVSVLLVAACDVPQAEGAARTLVVEAGKVDRQDVPMCIKLGDGAGAVKMLDQAGKEVPCQVADGMLWWVLDKLPAGKTKRYTVQTGAKSSVAEAVAIKKSDIKLDIAVGGKEFASYNFAPKLDWGGQLWRPCLFPVFGPGQVQMMRPYPLVKDAPKSSSKDHPHHTGIYVAHGAVNGTNNWHVGSKAARQIHKSFDLVTGGAVVGMFREVLDWTAHDGKPVMGETRTIRVYHLGGQARMIDLISDFHAKYGKVTFGDTKEGGLCATRMRDEMRADKGGKLVNSNGQSGKGAWGKRAEYVCCYGKLDGHEVGYAIFDSPGNLRHPTYWHARTYGLVTANPFGISHFDRKSGKKGTYVLEADKHRIQRYRIILYAGTPATADVAGRYKDFADPPKATWK